MFRIEGARAYQHGKKDGVHHRDHGLTAVIAERESFASESVFGGDANDQVIAMCDAPHGVRYSGPQGYRYRQCFDFGNFHELPTVQEGASEFYSLALEPSQNVKVFLRGTRSYGNYFDHSGRVHPSDHSGRPRSGA